MLGEDISSRACRRSGFDASHIFSAAIAALGSVSSIGMERLAASMRESRAGALGTNFQADRPCRFSASLTSFQSQPAKQWTSMPSLFARIVLAPLATASCRRETDSGRGRDAPPTCHREPW